MGGSHKGKTPEDGKRTDCTWQGLAEKGQRPNSSPFSPEPVSEIAHFQVVLLQGRCQPGKLLLSFTLPWHPTDRHKGIVDPCFPRDLTAHRSQQRHFRYCRYQARSLRRKVPALKAVADLYIPMAAYSQPEEHGRYMLSQR